MVLSLNATAFALEPEDYMFSATVITCRYVEATDMYSFCAVGDVYMSGNRDPFTFGISRESIKIADGLDLAIADGLAMGQVISVIFNGEVMESYPMQIVPNRIIVEEETEEFTDAEVLQYLSMFYTEEWLIENGYMEVPPAEGEAVEPTECDEDTTPPSENTQWEEGDLSENDTPSDEDLLICGVPLEGDEDGECVVLSEHYLDGFVVGAEFVELEVTPDYVGDLRGKAYIYFFAYSNFEDEMITPVLIEITEGRCSFIGTDMWSIDNGMKLKIYCSYDSYCVPIEGEKYYRLDGEVLTIEKLDGLEENYNDYVEYFWETDDSDVEPDDGGDVLIDEASNEDTSTTYGGEDCVTPDDLDPEYKAADDKTVEVAPIVEKTSEAKVIAVIITCIAVVAAVIFAGVKLIKKK